jgi:DNA-binding MarR family transcriptional regulator
MNETKGPAIVPNKDAVRRVMWTINRTDVALRAVKEPRLRAVGVPYAHYSLLMLIHTYPGLAGAEVARRLGVTTQAVALLAAKLEESGLVERRTHPRHRNVQELYLTPAGRDALSRADAVVADMEQRVCDALGPEKADELRELLGIVVAALSPSADNDA